MLQIPISPTFTYTNELIFQCTPFSKWFWNCIIFINNKSVTKLTIFLIVYINSDLLSVLPIIASLKTRSGVSLLEREKLQRDTIVEPTLHTKCVLLSQEGNVSYFRRGYKYLFGNSHRVFSIISPSFTCIASVPRSKLNFQFSLGPRVIAGVPHVTFT